MGTDRTLEAQLRDAILAAPVSRYVLSRASGVDEGTLSRFVRGERTLTLPTASKVAAALGLELCKMPRERKGG